MANNWIDFVGVNRSFVKDIEVRALFAGANPMWMKETTLEATGGTIHDEIIDGYSYRVHTFTSNGTFEITNGSGIIETWLVGGGGAGGANRGGGGGGGGVIQGYSVGNIGVNSYPIVVGEGGASVTNTRGANGSNTSAFGLVAHGGGGGGFQNTSNAFPGGCGGGAGGPSLGNTPTPGNGVKGQGFMGGAGGAAGGAAPRAGGGGGGAGGAGTDAVTSVGGNGGPGIQSNFDGTLTWYAPGGAGACNNTNGSPGVGGGGSAGTWTANSPTPTTIGAGGGGASRNGSGIYSGGGVNGITHIRYRIRDYHEFDLIGIVKCGNDTVQSISNTNILKANTGNQGSTLWLNNISTGANTGISLVVTNNGPNDNSTTGTGTNTAGEPTNQSTYIGSLHCWDIVQTSLYGYYSYKYNYVLANLIPNKLYYLGFLGTRNSMTDSRITTLTFHDDNGGIEIEYDVWSTPETKNIYVRADSSGQIRWEQWADNANNGSTYSYLSGFSIAQVL